MANLKILVVFDVSFPFVKGGGQRRFFEVSRRLSMIETGVDWMTFQAWPGSSVIVEQGIRYIGIGKPPPLYNSAGKRSKIEPVIFFFQFLKRIFELRKYDVIWVGQWPLLHLFPAIAFALFFQKRLIIDWWEVWSLGTWIAYSRNIGRIGYFLQTAILKLVAGRAIIVTDSTLEMSRIVESVQGTVDVRWIPNGVPVNEIGVVTHDEVSEYDIVSLGRLKDHKRVDLLIQAIWHLREKDGFVASAAIIGDGPEREALERMVVELKLSNQIRFFGHVPDPVHTYAIVKKGKVCAVTTVRGGGGNLTLFEAYGCGLPVVAFKTEEGIDSELIDEGSTGVFVMTPSAEALAGALLILLKDEQKIQSMKRNAYAKSLEFHWDEIANRYLKVFQGDPK